MNGVCASSADMRILFVCRQLDQMAGGVERMIIRVMHAMLARGHHVELFTWDQADATAFYPMDDAICWHRLDRGRATGRVSKFEQVLRMLQVRRVVARSKPDVLVAFEWGPFRFVRMAMLGLGIPSVLAERMSPSRFEHTRVGRYQERVFKGMRLATAIVVQWKSYINRYPEYLRDRMVAIPNVVDVACEHASPGRRTEGPFTLLSVGRLAYPKNYECLLRAFALLRPGYSQWRLRILGEGEDRRRLENLIDELDLNGSVELPGAVKDVAAEYASAEVFCLPSLSEGFPNALGEALAHGLPGVGFADCTGVNELISEGQNGVLAAGNGDHESLAKALDKLMGFASLREQLGTAARASMEVYAAEPLFERWHALLNKVSA